MQQSVVVGTFNNPREAERVADELRAENIAVELGESESAGGEFVGGVEVRVDEGEADRARDILGEAAPTAGDSNEDPFSEIEASEEEEWEEMTKGLHCPDCGSTKVGAGSPMLYGYLTATAIAFAGIFAVPAYATLSGVIFLGLVVVGIWAGATRRFPLNCSECGHRGAWSDFDPTLALREKAEAD